MRSGNTILQISELENSNKISVQQGKHNDVLQNLNSDNYNLSDSVALHFIGWTG